MAALSVGIVFIISFVVVVWMIRKAPRGYEDETGYHNDPRMEEETPDGTR